METQLNSLQIRQIAALIRKNWTNPYFGAKPYIDAMFSMNTIEDRFFEDRGEDIVARFLANAQTWRGEVARQVKTELNNRLKHK